MNQEFSKSWKASKRPGKQRKYAYNAPLHIRRKFLTVHCSTEIKEKTGKRNEIVKKDDKVKVIKGKFKGTIGKVLGVNVKTTMITVENVQVSKRDGSKVNAKMRPANLLIIELAERKASVAKKQPEVKKEIKEVKKSTKKIIGEKQ